MKKLERLLLFVFIALLFSCGKKVFINIEEIPTPPEARREAVDGAYEIALDNTTNSIFSDLRKDYPKVDEKILFLPDDADAAKIHRFYESKLTEKGFVKDANVPLINRNYELAAWRSDGIFGGQTIAVAVIDAGKNANGKSMKFLAVYSAEK